jgi:hypothetical protein
MKFDQPKAMFVSLEQLDIGIINPPCFFQASAVTKEAAARDTWAVGSRRTSRHFEHQKYGLIHFSLMALSCVFVFTNLNKLFMMVGPQ